MRACEPVAVEGNVVVLGFVHDFHRGKVEEEKNRRDVEDVLSSLAGQRYCVRCVLSGQESTTRTSQRLASKPTGREATASAEQIIKDPVVRAAVEDLGARIVQRHE